MKCIHWTGARERKREWYMDYSGEALETASVLPLRLSYLGRSEASRGFGLTNRSYSRFSIHLVVAGTMQIRQQREFYTANPGDVVLFHRSTSFDYRNNGSKSLLRRYLCIDGPLLMPVLEQTQLSECTICDSVNAREFASILKSIRVEMENVDRERHQRISTLIYSILMLISAARTPSTEPRVIGRLRRFVDEHMGEPIDRNRLAKASGVSVSLMHHLFRKNLGTTPMQFLLEQRLLRARHLLSCTSLSVKEISYRLGFEAPAHFSRRFKQSAGVSPKEFREGCMGPA